MKNLNKYSKYGILGGASSMIVGHFLPGILGGSLLLAAGFIAFFGSVGIFFKTRTK